MFIIYLKIVVTISMRNMWVGDGGAGYTSNSQHLEIIYLLPYVVIELLLFLNYCYLTQYLAHCVGCNNNMINILHITEFWFILVVVFFHIVICCICMWRRTSAGMRYKRIAEVQPAGYSSVTVSNQSQYTHVQPPQYNQQPTAPQQYPPQYQQPTDVWNQCIMHTS